MGATPRRHYTRASLGRRWEPAHTEHRIAPRHGGGSAVVRERDPKIQRRVSGVPLQNPRERRCRILTPSLLWVSDRIEHFPDAHQRYFSGKTREWPNGR